MVDFLIAGENGFSIDELEVYFRKWEDTEKTALWEPLLKSKLRELGDGLMKMRGEFIGYRYVKSGSHIISNYPRISDKKGDRYSS